MNITAIHNLTEKPRLGVVTLLWVLCVWLGCVQVVEASRKNYDVELGRTSGNMYTQMDTWQGIQNDPVTLHKYLYANADPVNYIDPTGNFSIGSVLSGIGTIARSVASVGKGVGISVFSFARSASSLGKKVVIGGKTVIIRVQYMKRVRGLNKIAEQMRKNGKSSEEIAKVLNRKRRAIGRLFKHVTDAQTRQNAFARNLKKYGDKWGPTWQYLRRQGKSWDDIIESSARPNSSLKELLKIFFDKR